MTRVLRLLATLLLAAPVLVLWSATPARACSCAMSTVRGYAEGADAVFVATITDGGQFADPVSAAVDTVYRGDVADEVEVATGARTSQCGITGLREGQPWVFYATAEPGDPRRFGVSLCSGSQQADAALQEQVERVLGPGRAAAPPSPPAPGTPPTVPEPADQADGGRTALVVGASGAAVAVALLATVVVARRRRPTG